MECSNPQVNLDLTHDPLLNTYIVTDSAFAPEEMQAQRAVRRAKRANVVDTAI